MPGCREGVKQDGAFLLSESVSMKERLAAKQEKHFAPRPLPASVPAFVPALRRDLRDGHKSQRKILLAIQLIQVVTNEGNQKTEERRQQNEQ